MFSAVRTLSSIVYTGHFNARDDSMLPQVERQNGKTRMASALQLQKVIAIRSHDAATKAVSIRMRTTETTDTDNIQNCLVVYEGTVEQFIPPPRIEELNSGVVIAKIH